MKKVYILTSGSYSDYHIEAVFEDKEKAEKIASRFIDFDVEEWDITDGPDLSQIDRKIFRVQMYKDGKIRWLNECDDLDDYQKALNREFEISSYDGGFLQAYIFADDKKHAVKIVNEKRVQLIAMNKWSTP